MYSSDRKTAGELKAIGEQRGWKSKKEITFAQLNGMGSLEMQFHETFSPEAMKIAMEGPRKKAASQKQRLSDMWAGKLGAEADAAGFKAGNTFADKYPQLIRDETNAKAISGYMQSNGLDGTEVESYEAAFQALAACGELHLNPSAVGLGTEKRIDGYTVKNHPQLHLLLQPAPNAETRKRRELYKPELSADEFRKQTPELQNGPSYAERQSINLAVLSLPHFEPEYVPTEENGNKLLQYIHKNKLQFNLTGLRVAFNALKSDLELKPTTVQAGKTTVTNYESRQNQGEPLVPEKLKAKIRSLSSNELLQFYRDHPGAEKAVNSMQ